MAKHSYQFTGTPCRVRGSVSLEVVFVLPVLLIVMIAASEVLTIFRLEQRLTNLNYNVLEMVGNRRTLTRDNNIAQLPYFKNFAEEQLQGIVAGQAGLSIALHMADTDKTEMVLADGLCPISNQWPEFEAGSLVAVSLCFVPDSEVRSNAIWSLWPQGRFTSHMLRETK